MSAAEIVSLFRGLYNRVARQLRVDPSYVSRVARGQRESEEVRALLDEEIGQILRQARAFPSADGDGHGLPKKPMVSGVALSTRMKNVPSNGNHRGKTGTATKNSKAGAGAVRN